MTLPVTALTAAICAIMLLACAIATVVQRGRSGTILGLPDEKTDLFRISRAHGNLAEHAPLAILMIGLLEAANASHVGLTAVAVLFLAARASHIVGIANHRDLTKIQPLRAAGVVGTWIAYAVLIAWILVLVVTLNG